MKNIYIVIFFSVFSTLFSSSIYSTNTDYGLHIKAFPVADQDKGSLILENNQPLKLHKETTLTFDMYVRKENVFGVVTRIVTNKKDNIDLIFTVGDNNKRYPMLVINESVYLISEEIQCEKWIPVSLTFSSVKEEIRISYGDSYLSAAFTVSKSNNFLVSFGLCPFDGYTLSDIASVNIRDVKIFAGTDMIRYWKLDKHNESLTYDSVANKTAITVNPQWLSDLYASWKKIYTRSLKEYSLFAYDQNRNLIYIVSPDSKEVLSFDPERQKEEALSVKGGVIAANASNQLFFDPIDNVLVSYNLNENFSSKFSFIDQTWDSKRLPTLEHAYWNNTVTYSASDSTILSFGGYGFYKYNNELIKMDSDGKIIKKSNLPDISPRYSAASVIVDNILYIFGGRGNRSGRQELSPRNVYDFYSVNLLTEQTNKLWEEESMGAEFLPSENMIYDKEENCFYIYTIKDGGVLLRLRTDKKGFEQVSFPIREDLSSHYLYTNLYFSPQYKKFYALVYKSHVDKTSEVYVYSLSYPPIVIGPSSRIEQIPQESQSSSLLTIILIIIGSLLAGIIIYKILKKKNNSTIENQSVNPLHSTVQNIITINKGEEQEEIDETGINYYDFSKQAICFLGGFMVKDRNEQNITGQFTPMLKYLLVLLTLATQKDPKGISGKKLIQLLWFDKDENSAKNNRNVYLSKLRAVFENVGEVEVINQNGFWTIKFNDGIVCDYIEAMRLFSKIKENKILDRADIHRLLELLLQGVLLPNTEADWIDGFKSDFSNMTIDILTQLSHNNHYKLSDDLKLKIADTLFLHDYVNEEALFLKCSILFFSGKKGIAKTIYDNFCKEYQNLLGVSYRYSLSDVINRKNIEL